MIKIYFFFSVYLVKKLKLKKKIKIFKYFNKIKKSKNIYFP